MTRMKNRFGDRFAILFGVDRLVCTFPTETVAFSNLVNAGRIQDAIQIYRWFLPLLELDINPKLVQNLKYVC